MTEKIYCKLCGEYEDVQILTEQYHEQLCFLCYAEKEEVE